MTKIEKLTPEQEAELPRFRKEYLDIACGGARADRDALQSALDDAYAVIGKSPPKLFIFDSPAACMLAIKIFEIGSLERFKLGDQLGDQLRGQLGDQFGDQLGDQFGGQLRDQLQGQLRDQLGGQLIYNPHYLWGSQDLYWIAWGKFAEKIGVKLKPETSRNLDIMDRIGRQCEWWWPCGNMVIVSQRPVTVRWDGENRLHCENGPAVEYADGYAVYAWRGLRIPGGWITDAPPPAAEIMRLENTEQRRIACEMRGWHNILPELGAKLIDSHPNPQVGELWEANLPDNGPERFLKVQCGTGRTFAMPVGMEFATAREANAATYGISPQILDNLQFRT